ncbi:DNA/RNA nuclease SfsA [bacterium]|nr:DNA/RNA nuclease SfsA [bacterium]
MKFGDLVPATFIKRGNRFTAGVMLDGGGASTAYVPTTGRLTGALKPGCRVWLEPADNPDRKTAYTLVLSELADGSLCSVNAYMANWLFAEAMAAGSLDVFPYPTIEKEVTIGRSRLDFRLSSENEFCWVEVKSVTYAEEGVGMFPDAPTARGRKHLGELAKLAAEGYRASVVFIAQREDAHQFAPFERIDPDFAAELRRVAAKGVEVHAFRCAVSTDEVVIAEEIPVSL